MMIIDQLFTARDKAELLRINLTKLIEKEQPSYRTKIREEIELLENAIENSELPETFRIAVVGTFKTGKSSFVNKLSEEKLAGVETNPETAAISIFRYADNPRAEVRLISTDEWAKMEDLYDENPKNPEAYRVAGLNAFNEDMAKIKSKLGQPINFEPIDPDNMVKEWVKPDGNVHVIEAKKWDTKQGKQLFRKEIRKFTSSRNPLHYFVKELSIYAPVPLFRNHVELIDTPGLNDTQLYRGQLTENLLSEVDAILFLTRSGASFSQYDKEFIIRQLRKKRLRHLRLVVTQVDTTFDAARHDAIEEDEDPPSFSEVRTREEARLRTEISKTLDELLEDSDLKDEDGYYYMEQLDDLKIHFTSARWFDDGRIEDSGIPAIKEALFELLSENYHLNQLLENLKRTIDSIRSRLQSFFNERRAIMEAEFDSKKVTNSMEVIEKKLIDHLDSFETKIKTLTDAHETDQTALQELMDANIARMQLIAKAVLSEFEKTDVAKHWKTRRHGYWGYLNVLGEKVADKVFPVMEVSLKRKIKSFEEFLELASGSLDGLQSEIEKLESESALQGLPKIEFSEAKNRFMINYVEEMKESVINEKDAIVELLEEFATGELKEKLSGAKDDVSDVWGKGTTILQNDLVSSFYDDIGNTLSNALSQFLRKRMNAFSASLSKNTRSLYPKLRSSVQTLLDTRKQLIQEHLLMQTDEARKKLENYLELGIDILQGKNLLLISDNEQKEKPNEIEFNIKDNDIGYSYEILFGPYIANSDKIIITEPYLGLKYQLHNFNQFCSLVARIGNIKTIELTTGSLTGEIKDFSDSYLEDIHKRLLEDYSIELKWKRDPNLHSREIKTGDGWVILSDRGLDIYKKPESRNEFGHFDLALRKCKQTKVHIRKKL